jgi:hypothetical protein
MKRPHDPSASRSDDRIYIELRRAAICMRIILSEGQVNIFNFAKKRGHIGRSNRALLCAQSSAVEGDGEEFAEFRKQRLFAEIFNGNAASRMATARQELGLFGELPIEVCERLYNAIYRVRRVCKRRDDFVAPKRSRVARGCSAYEMK